MCRGIDFGASGKPFVAPEQLDQLVECARIVAAVEIQPRRQAVGEGVLVQQVASPDLKGIHAELGRDELDRTLHHDIRGFLAVAANTLPRRLVRSYDHGIDGTVSDVVDGGKYRRRDHRHRPSAARADRSDIGADEIAECDDLAIRPCGDFEFVRLLAAVGEEAFLPALQEGYWTAELAALHRDDHFLWMADHLEAERAAHRRRYDPDTGLWQTERLSQHPSRRVRLLQGAMEGELAGTRVPVGDVASGFERGGGRRTEAH